MHKATTKNERLTMELTPKATNKKVPLGLGFSVAHGRPPPGRPA